MEIDYEFIKNLILIVVPIVLGGITTQLVTNSWQQRKERNEIKRKILHDFDNSYGKAHPAVTTLFNRINSEYHVFAKKIKTEKEESEELDNNDFIPPIKYFKEDYESMEKEFWRGVANTNQLLSSIRLYYEKSETIEKSIVDCSNRLGVMEASLRSLLTSDTRETYRGRKQNFRSVIDEFSQLSEKLHRSLVDNDIVLK